MSEIIVATWGIGKSYRNRIKHNIRKAINTGYDKVLPYIILTDNVSDFDDIRSETNLIIDVIDIFKEREKYSTWSKDIEFIPTDIEETDFAKSYRNENYTKEKIFSYGLNRFSLPRIAELGYSKFLLCDSDTDIRYDRIVNNECTEEEFWLEYDTPINSMKGCDLEHFHLQREGNWNKHNVMMANILRYHLHTKYRKFKQPDYLGLEYYQTEGPFRYYNLDSTQKVIDVFNLWDESLRFLLSERTTRMQLCPGRYMYIDNVPFSITNELLEIQILNFDKFWHTVNIYIADRYYFPKGHQHMVNGKMLSFQPANSREEFYKINEELIDYFKSTNQWID